MSTVHLTAEEKRNLKIASEADAAKIRADKRARRIAREEAKKEAVERRQMETVPVPSAQLAQMFPTLPLPGTPYVPFDAQRLTPEVKLDPFIEEIAAQPGFREALGENIEDPRAARFLKLLGEVEHRSMTWCARTAGLNNFEVAKIWRNSKLARAFFRIVNRMESLADKVVDDAMGTRRSCPRCDGFGRVEVPEPLLEFFQGEPTTICPNCEGKKTVAVVGSAPDKQLIWEKIGWSKQKGGVSVNVNMSEHSVDSTFEEMEGIESEVLEHR